jgi:hypothetical protein
MPSLMVSDLISSSIFIRRSCCEARTMTVRVPVTRFPTCERGIAYGRLVSDTRARDGLQALC